MKICLSWFLREAVTDSLLLFDGGLGGEGGFFLLFGAAVLRGLLVGFLLIGLRGFIAHNFYFILRFDLPAAWKFLRREWQHDGLRDGCKSSAQNYLPKIRYVFAPLRPCVEGFSLTAIAFHPQIH